MDKLHFDNTTVLDCLRHEHPQYYTLQMVNGPDVMVSIDKMVDVLWRQGEIKIAGNVFVDSDVRYNNETFEDASYVRTQITTEDVYYLLNSGLVDYTVIEPEPCSECGGDGMILVESIVPECCGNLNQYASCCGNAVPKISANPEPCPKCNP